MSGPFYKYSVQIVLGDQFVIFHGIQKLVKCVGGRFIFFVAVDVLELRVACRIPYITVQIDFPVGIGSVLIQRKKGDIFPAVGIENYGNSAFDRLIVVKSQRYGYPLAAAGRAVAAAFGLITCIGHL